MFTMLNAFEATTMKEEKMAEVSFFNGKAHVKYKKNINNEY